MELGEAGGDTTTVSTQFECDPAPSKGQQSSPIQKTDAEPSIRQKLVSVKSVIVFCPILDTFA